VGAVVVIVKDRFARMAAVDDVVAGGLGPEP